MWTMKKLHLKIPRKKDQDFGIFWNWIRYWFNLDRKNGCTLEQEPQEAMKHLAAEFLDGDQSFLTDQKPGETIFEFVPGFIDFLKPSTEEKRNKGPCLNCGVSSTTVIHHGRADDGDAYTLLVIHNFAEQIFSLFIKCFHTT